MAQEETKPNEPARVTSEPPTPPSARGPYLAVGALAILLVGFVAWKYSSVRRVEERAATERTELVEQTRKVLTDQTGYFLRLTAKPFVWAIRKEMLRENYELTPVMGLSSRLGSLLFVYAPETIDIAGPQGGPGARLRRGGITC